MRRPIINKRKGKNMRSKYIIFAILALFIAAGAGYTARTTLVYFNSGGNEITVASGGKIDVESGGELEVDSGGTADINRIDGADVILSDSLKAATVFGTNLNGTTSAITTGNITRANLTDATVADTIYVVYGKVTTQFIVDDAATVTSTGTMNLAGGNMFIPTAKMDDVAGSMYIHGDTLYVYTGSAWEVVKLAAP